MRRRARAALLSFATLSILGCGDDGHADVGPDASDASRDADESDASADAAELTADAGPSRYAVVGEEVLLDGSASTGAVAYLWDFGNGDGWDAPREDAAATVTYVTPGRFRAVLTVIGADGNRRSDGVVISVTSPIVHEPRSSSTLTVLPDGTVAVVSTDSDELVFFADEGDGWVETLRRPTAAGPRTVTFVGGIEVAVACQDADVVEFHAARPDSPTRAHSFTVGSRPFGVVTQNSHIFVTLQGRGAVAELSEDLVGTPQLVTTHEAILEDPRAVAVLPNERIAVTRWRSPDERGEIAVMDFVSGTTEIWPLAYDPTPGSDTESGGVPSYLEQLVVSPTGDLAIVPSLQAAIGEGLFVSERPLTHETTVRAVVSFIDLQTGVEDTTARKQFDDRGFASAAVFTSRGDYAFVAMRGARTIERLDILTGNQAGSILDVGYAVDGLALSSDDRLLFANASLSRELVIYDVSNFDVLPTPLARLPLVTSEPLGAEVLRGKQLFNDSADPRIARDGYIACAHCHLDGMADQRTWDFTDRGEGLRNTIDLRGRAGTGHGPLHWSANFDEVQDFEHDMRGPFRGTGLMSDADFAVGTRSETLGDPKAGVSEDLDALAAYVTSLDTYLPSPHRSEGALSPAAQRGRVVFERADVGCTTCHGGPALTDSALDAPTTPRLHDVGTFGPGSGGRLGGDLPGIDTPTLHGLFQSAPYLHDGSAATLQEVLTSRNPLDRHGNTSILEADEIEDLVAYLLSLDGRVD